MGTADFALEQSSTIRLLTILSRSKFAYTKLKETAAFFCFVYAGLADGYVFIPVMLVPIVVCCNFNSHKAHSIGRFPPLDRWHMGQALI